MAITHRQQNARAQKRRAMVDALPPKKFVVAVNPHIFDPSTIIGDKTCLRCKQPVSHRLHISRHVFIHNPASTLGKCICGLSCSNSIHTGEAPYETH
jgi:hypothetical protein